MSQPIVDLIIAVHDPARPIARAVRSVLSENDTEVRLTVVCHNTSLEGIRALVPDHVDDKRLRFLELHDGIRSPTGPFNKGLDAATAAFTSVMGSDDELEPGAIASWLALARMHNADAVVARVQHAGGRTIPTPPARPFRSAKLDGVRDRLSYRSAPLGLVSRSHFGELRFVEGLASGEDIDYVTRIWFSGALISLDRSGPAYLVHDDALDRVSGGEKPVASDVEFLERLVASDALEQISTAQRGALCLKLLRVNMFGLVHNRMNSSVWGPEERANLAAATRLCLSLAPGTVIESLSRADRRLLDAMADESVDTKELLSAATARRKFLTFSALIPRKFRHAFDREAPLRFAAASILVGRLP